MCAEVPVLVVRVDEGTRDRGEPQVLDDDDLRDRARGEGRPRERARGRPFQPVRQRRRDQAPGPERPLVQLLGVTRVVAVGARSRRT